MPKACAACGPGSVTGVPSSTMLPESGARAPERILSSVLLPAPFSPSRAWISPRATSRSTSRSACTPGKPLLIPAMRSRGGADGPAALPVVIAPAPERLVQLAEALGLVEVVLGDDDGGEEDEVALGRSLLFQVRHHDLHGLP